MTQNLFLLEMKPLGVRACLAQMGQVLHPGPLETAPSLAPLPLRAQRLSLFLQKQSQSRCPFNSLNHALGQLRLQMPYLGSRSCLDPVRKAWNLGLFSELLVALHR